MSDTIAPAATDIKEISLDDIRALKKKMKKFSTTWAADMVALWNEEYKDEEIITDKIYNIINNRVTHQKYRRRFVFIAAKVIASVTVTQKSAEEVLNKTL